MAIRMKNAALAAVLLAIPVATATAEEPSGSTLDWPVGNHAWIGVASTDMANQSKADAVVFDEFVSVQNAAWLRLHFGADTKLGKGSFIRITSLRDGEVQELDSKALAMWNESSAYFNGNTLRVELIAGGLTANGLAIDTATWEPIATERGDSCGICNTDDRVPSSDNRFGRLMPTGCSATLYNADSCMVTAGHCIASGDVIQFNVPNSNSDCSTNQPPVSDQFPLTSIDGVNGGVGNDYGAVKAGTNGDGQTPYEKYGAFVDIAGSVPTSGTLTVNGYGVDSECTRSQIQQYCEGPILSVNSTAIMYNLDVTYGNSGSSLLYNGEIVGVVTHCSYSCENYGTRIDRSGFETLRDNVCAGNGGGGDCAAGEIEDCFGNCCPDYWVGDGYCDDGSYSWNGVAIYLNCDEFDCDGGDCDPADCSGGGDPTGGCCVGTSCSVTTEAECGGDYLGDNTDCSGDPCGGGDPTGGCCVGTSCTVVTQSECGGLGGSYLGDGTNCAGDPCGGGGGGDGDSCGDAVVASEGGNAFDTSSMSDSGYGDPDESQCDGTYLDWDGSPDFWFVWTPGADGTASFSTCDTSSYDTSMVLYEGTSCSSLSQIACNGDYADSSGCQAYHSQIDGVTVSSGQSYYIRLGGWLGAAGAGTLTIDADLGTPMEGACCFGETCEYLAANTCAANGGMYIGDGVACSPNPCEAPAQGACCLSDVCEVMDELTCTSSGGAYQGDDTTCAGDPCGSSDLGACCVGTSCNQYSAAECEIQGGTFHGVGSSCDPNPCDVGGSDIAISWRVIGVDLTALDQPHYTVDVYLETPDGWRLDAVAGNQTQLKTIASTGTFYQDDLGGPTTLDVNPGFYDMVPDLEWDSRVGIGAIDSSGNPYDSNDLNHIGIDFTDFENGGDVSADNGVWFVIPDDPAGGPADFISQDCTVRNGVWIARLTTFDLSSEIMFDALFQGRDADNVVWQLPMTGMVAYQGEQDCNLNRVPDACDIANGTSEDSNGNGVPDECDSGCSGDTDGDGDTDVDDILNIINGFGGQYNVDDLLTAIADFGCTP